MSPPFSEQFKLRFAQSSRWAALCISVIVACSGFGILHADEIDDSIVALMHERHIPGLSLAIIDSGRIVKAKGYGFADKSLTTPVTPATLFQTGSVSKSVAAFGALTASR